MTATTAEDAFLADIVAHPEDDVPRLIYADWLEDQGREPRANVIRQMIAEPRWFDERQTPSMPLGVGSVPPWDVLRAYEWLSHHADREVEQRYGLPSEPDPGSRVWHHRHAGVMGTMTWVRGFVGAVTLPWGRFRCSATRLFRCFPVEWVTLNGLHPVEAGGADWCWIRCGSEFEGCGAAGHVPGVLARVLSSRGRSGPGDLVYESEAAARQALADAALALGRQWRDDTERKGEL